jgi:hypothetical protein
MAYMRDENGQRLDTLPVGKKNTFAASDHPGRLASTPQFQRLGVAFTQAQSSLGSLYHPWMMKVRGLLANPINDYYLYVSTNHATIGGIELWTAPAPTGPWTKYGDRLHRHHVGWADRVAVSNVGRSQQRHDPVLQADQRHQSPPTQFLPTMYATSTDGITFTRQGIAITKPAGMPGSGSDQLHEAVPGRPRLDGLPPHRRRRLLQHGLAAMSYDGYTWVVQSQAAHVLP